MQVRVLLAAVVFAAACSGGDGASSAASRAGGGADDIDRAGTTAAVASPSSSVVPPSMSEAERASPTAGGPGRSAVDPARSPAEADAAIVATGTYAYSTSGYSESGSGATARRRSLPATTTDTVIAGRAGDGSTEVIVETDFGDGSTQRVTLQVSRGGVNVRQLAFTSTTAGGVQTEQSLTPNPPIVLYRSPLVVGDRWEAAWEDAAYGVQGIGTGEVVRQEAATTPNGSYDTFVVHLDHRLRGSVSGRLELTVWIDPVRGVRVKDKLVLDAVIAGSPSHLEYARELKS